MIESLRIRNFKSIKSLDLNCKRVNLFIGEPNTGKSNILETIGVLSHVNHGFLNLFVRFENMSNLFFDQDLENPINISFNENRIGIKFQNGLFLGDYFDSKDRGKIFSYNYDGSGTRGGSETAFRNCLQFKFYRFAIRRDFPNQRSEYLYPPDGDNLSQILITRRELRNFMQKIFNKFGYKLAIQMPEGKITIQKGEDIIIVYPYSTISDTLRRIVFYLAAIYSNKGSVIAFEEPEAHAFPYYTKYLAERIALDQNKNQYFISTHNPYLLKSVIEKAPKEEVSVNITYIENYETKVKQLSETEIREILDLDLDVLFNLERFLAPQV